MPSAHRTDRYAVDFDNLAEIVRKQVAQGERRSCKACGAPLRMGNKAELCGPCVLAKEDALRPKPYRTCACGRRAVGDTNSWNICSLCVRERAAAENTPRPIIVATEVTTQEVPTPEGRICSGEDCGMSINRNNQTGLCNVCRNRAKLDRKRDRVHLRKAHEHKGPNDIANEEAPPMEVATNAPVRICSREGCGKILGPTNNSGRCAAHWYQAKTAKGTGERVKGYAKPAKAEAPAPPPLGDITLKAFRMVHDGGITLNNRHYVGTDSQSCAAMYLANETNVEVRLNPLERTKAFAYKDGNLIANLIDESLRSASDAEGSAMTLTITGKQADKFFSALKPEDKCSALQGLFDQLEA